MKIFLSIFVLQFLLFGSSKAQEIEFTSENQGASFTDYVHYVEDVDNQLTLNEVISGSGLIFQKFNHSTEIIQFTSSSFWLKFSILNHSDREDLILDIARPITNQVLLFSSLDNYTQPSNSGDDFPFSEKVIKHKSNLFPVHIPQGEKVNFIVKLKSDGEIIPLPVKIHYANNLVETTENSAFNGVYYGILLLAVIIFIFFYKLLKDKSFLYYVLYVSSLFLFQFSLDGYGYQYFFSNGGYWANHSILATASLTVFFLILYSKSYLQVEGLSKTINSIFKVLMVSVALFGVLSLIPGKIYETMYPVINGISLLVAIFILFTIAKFKKVGARISPYFTIAFSILILGAIVFILGNFHIINNADLSLNSLKYSSAIEVVLLSVSMAYKYKDISIEKEEAQLLALKNLEEKNKIIDQQNHLLETEVSDRTQELKQQKEILEEKNKEIVDSINYAKRLQEALIPSEQIFQSILKDSFILFKPKDIVSGDFYWITELVTTKNDGSEEDKLIVFSVADCTGHGVPGALMSIIGIKTLNQSVKNKEVNSTNEALDYLNNDLFQTVNKHKNEGEIIRDGMDLSLCALNIKKRELYYSGANNSIYVVRDKELIELKADKQAIGSSIDHAPFTSQKIELIKGDMIFAFTDGYPDQFGGPRGKKLKYKKFKEILTENSGLEMSKQKTILSETLDDWQGNLEQLDDICVIGIRV